MDRLLFLLRLGAPLGLLGLLAVASPGIAQAQATVDVPGIVLNVENGRGIQDVILRVLGTDISAATDDRGEFVLRRVPEGTWTLQVVHLAFGTREHQVAFAADQNVRLQIRMAPEAIELEPIIVETTTTRQRAERAQGSSLHVVERDEIVRALGTSRNMGELIRQTVPGLRMRQSTNLVGYEMCLEFRGAATMSLVESRPCSHPMVLLDGVPVSNPTYLYGQVGLSTIQRIQMIPPGEAGARYGTGSLYGVLLIETVRPGGLAPEDRPLSAGTTTRRRVAFDWEEDPAGHPLPRAVAGAFLGNAAGLALGVALAEQCIGVDQRNQIVTSCSGLGNAAAVLGAFALPALGGALGARWGGGTDTSVGNIIPALVGAGMMLFPGYAFSMSTVGGGSEAANAVGATLLVVGAPVVITIADRIFRHLR